MIIKVLTPTSITSGEEYPQEEYVIKDKFLYRIDLLKFIKTSGPNASRIVTSILLNNNADIKNFIPEIRGNEDYIIYKLRSRASPKEAMIKEQVKEDKLPYIPGSSIKGAIRTMLMWKIISNNTLVKEKIESLILGNNIKGLDYLLRQVLNIDMGVSEMLHNVREKSFNDFMRFISVRDFTTEEKDCLVLYLFKRMKNKTPLNFFVEGIRESSVFQGSIEFNESLFKKQFVKNELILKLYDEIRENGFFNFLKNTSIAYNKWHEKKIEERFGRLEFPDTSDKFVLRVGFGKGIIYQTLLYLFRNRMEWIKKRKKIFKSPNCPSTYTICEGKLPGFIEVIKDD